MLRDVVKTAMKRFDSYLSKLAEDVRNAGARARGESGTADEEDVQWDWDRWRKHFDEIDSQERLVSILKVNFINISASLPLHECELCKFVCIYEYGVICR